MGLRERKKQAQRARLLSAAIDLFRTKGYEQTRMEQIAQCAGVTPPTLYSYFPTKQALLLALFWRAREIGKKTIDPLLADPPDDPVEAVTALILADMEGMDSPREKKLWREVLAAQVRAHDQRRDEIYSYKFVFESQLRQMLRHFIDKGRLPADFHYRIAAKTLYAITWDVFSDLIADETARPRDTRAWIEPQVRLLLERWVCAKGTSRKGTSSKRKAKTSPAARRTNGSDPAAIRIRTRRKPASSQRVTRTR